MTGFAESIANFRKKAEESCKLVHKIVTADLQQAIMKDTPVKTGRAKANWQVGVITPPTTAIYEKVTYEDEGVVDESNYDGVF